MLSHYSPAPTGTTSHHLPLLQMSLMFSCTCLMMLLSAGISTTTAHSTPTVSGYLTRCWLISVELEDLRSLALFVVGLACPIRIRGSTYCTDVTFFALYTTPEFEFLPLLCKVRITMLIGLTRSPFDSIFDCRTVYPVLCIKTRWFFSPSCSTRQRHGY